MTDLTSRPLPPVATQTMASPEEALSAAYRFARIGDQRLSEEQAWKFYWQEQYLDPMRAALGEDVELPDPPDLFVAGRLQTDPDPESFLGEVDLFLGFRTKQAEIDEFNAFIRAHPELIALPLLSFGEHEERVVQSVNDAFDEASRPTTTKGDIASLIGGLGAEFRQMKDDPVRGLSELIVGGAVKRGGALVSNTIRVGLFEGLYNAGLEGANTPSVMRWRAKVGLAMSPGEAISRLGGAFAFGAVLGGGGYATVAGTGKLFGAMSWRGEKGEGRSILDLSDAEVEEGLEALRADGRPVSADVEGGARTAARQEEIDFDNPLEGENAVDRHRARLDETEHGVNDEQPIILPETTTRAVDLHHFDNLDETVYSFDPSAIEVDAKTFQFKSGGDEFGVTERLSGVTEWDPIKAGQIIVYEFADGRRVIADGHQRLGLARRIQAADPAQKPIIYGSLLRERDGVTPDGARLTAALKNIAEGTGSVVDAAKVLRIDPARIADPSFPRTSGLVRTARDLTNLSNEAFGLVENEVVPANYAAIVGRLVEDPQQQMAILRLLNEAGPANVTQAEAMVRQALEADFERGTEVDLFGEEEIAVSLFKERAKILDQALLQLRQGKQMFSLLGRERERIEGEGNVLAHEQNLKRSEVDAQAKEILQKAASKKGAISDALNAAARQYAETGSWRGPTDEFLGNLRHAIERGDLDGVGTVTEGRGIDAGSEGDRLAASPPSRHVAEIDDPFDGDQVAKQADALEAQAQPREAFQSDVDAREDLRRVVNAGATPDEIEAHPAVVEALERAMAIPETHLADGYGSADWEATRQFNFDGETVVGYEAGVSRLYEGAKRLGWEDEGKALGTVRQERHASIILGPPASGKSGFANPIAQRNGAAVIDPDEAKAVLPEYDGGIGANAVHRESSELAQRMRDIAIENGDNIVLPKTGAKTEQIELIMDELAAEGYTVDLVLVNVHGDEAYRRMIQRFIATGRLVHPAYVRGMGLKPLDTFNTLKSKARRYAEIDNNGPFSAEKPLIQVSADDPLEGVNIRLRRGGVGGGERVGGKARSTPRTEATDQGAQGLIAGVEPLTLRDTLEEAIEAPLRGGEQPADFGLFDYGARRQGELIPTGIEADAEGNIAPTFTTRGEMLDEATPEERAFERLKDCV